MRNRIIFRWVFVLICSFSIVLLPHIVQGEGINSEIISTLDVSDADIRDIFRSLAELGGFNILLDPAVKGPVTTKLKYGLTVKEAVELLAQTYGYSFRWNADNRTVIIGNEKTFSSFNDKETRVYRLNNAQADQVADALKSIVVKDQIGIDKRTNQLTIKASTLEQQNIGELIAKLDRELPQINIDARVEEISTSATKELGISWEFPEFSISNSFEFNLKTAQTLAALETQNKAKLLANPNISTTDSQEGKIFIGDKTPVITSEKSDDGDVEYKVEYIDVGTTLTVTPRVNDNNIVTVTVKAVVSNIAEWKKTGSGDEVPLVRTREVSSVVRLQDGETFVLSGLTQTRKGENTSGVPGFSKIPLLGALFRSKTDGPNEDTQICIFITPRVVRSKSEQANSVKTGQIETKTVPAVVQPKLEQGEVRKDIAEQEQNSKSPLKKEENTASSTSQLPEINKQPDPIQNAPVVFPSVKETTQQEANLQNSPPQPEVASVDIQTTTETNEVIFPELVETKTDNGAAQSVSIQVEAAPVPEIGLKKKVTVKPGQTLQKIAGNYGVTVESIAKENRIKAVDKINVGKVLLVPIPRSHLYQVKPKETVWRIANRYGLTVERLKALNHLTDITKIESGQLIILPVSVDEIVNSQV
ncbi:type II secretory pathway component GspD/PulD (secretin) [Hydrogenispora ethanolica]|uniref:Type II secretory pathway component GspD/PulD (Secretin) n=1 Tax=Hydrogenispora ethanolica TaxID=1082276 RepID=A0A4R1RME1_HYDET|nr:LysM peptidoglycan-binding domain-containing protein [Hydrogenispora ethanolica]TCL67435.1 type II secretory pathway component GspD/PulD (secretin) [Hydrogenispora ethanolica]